MSFNKNSINIDMKFLNICKNLLEEKKLQKVRVKVDPVWAEKLGLHNSPDFEGYILQECSGSEVKVFIVNIPPGYDPVQSVDKSNVEPVEDAPQEIVPSGNYSKLTLLKKAVLEKLLELGKEKDSPEVIQVLNSKDLGFIETFLRQMGLNDEDLLNLYRKCFKKV
jgi:hypothetical protein